MGFIGVIDSGVGGLTVLQKLRQRYSYNFVYLADHAYCPYGKRSNEALYSRARKLVDFLKSNGAQAVVLACNTLSYFAEPLRQNCFIPVYNVIGPTCARIADVGARRVALLATRSTIANGAYQAKLLPLGIQVFPFDCSAFVPFVEQRLANSRDCLRAVDAVLRGLPKVQADAVVLGCTHFPLLLRQISPYCVGSRIIECSVDLPENIAEATDVKQSVVYLTTGDVNCADNAASCFDETIHFKTVSLS